MFLEVHSKENEGRPILLNTRYIHWVGKDENGDAYLYIDNDDRNMFVEEAYEDIRRALHNEIVSVGHDESVERVVWRRNDKKHHTCSVCGQTWTGYYDMCPKCGTIDFSF